MVHPISFSWIFFSKILIKLSMDNQLNGCLFVADFGVFKVYCDFWVICIQSVHIFSIGDVLLVTDVSETASGRLVYEIGGDHYYHHSFRLGTRY